MSRPRLRDAARLAESAGVQVDTDAREGDPADAILDVAEASGPGQRLGSVAAAASTRPLP